MGHCSLCGEEQNFPFECSYCGLTYCSRHRLPENHLCSGFSGKYNVDPKYNANSTEPDSSVPIHTSEPSTPPHSPSHSSKPSSNQRKRLSKTWLTGAALILVAVLSMGILATSAQLDKAREDGIDQGYKQGLDAGKLQETQEVQQAAYLEGYTKGQAEGTAKAYAEGYNQGLANRSGYYTQDPSYSDMKAFLASDKTNENEPDFEDYNCYDYTRDLCENALRQNIQCGFVYIELSGLYSHAIVCFNTTDRGLIFVEPQNDNEVKLEIGSSYEGFGENYSSSDDLFFDSLLRRYELNSDTIEDYGIIW